MTSFLFVVSVVVDAFIFVSEMGKCKTTRLTLLGAAALSVMASGCTFQFISSPASYLIRSWEGPSSSRAPLTWPDIRLAGLKGKSSHPIPSHPRRLPFCHIYLLSHLSVCFCGDFPLSVWTLLIYFTIDQFLLSALLILPTLKLVIWFLASRTLRLPWRPQTICIT